MIETLTGFPADTVAVRCSGFISKADYDQVLVPAVEQTFKANERVRFYYEVAPDYSGFSPGAALEDFWVGMRHLTRWKRIAVVTDVPWMRQMVHMFGFLWPAATKVFAIAEAAEARAWLIEEA
ncbi:MAG TPA: STAS/SEC14 domain-containing protein [Roseiarcus sp.]|nr:STAS/SEC14 domain-containing protein [Roseiarcus sp.]